MTKGEIDYSGLVCWADGAGKPLLKAGISPTTCDMVESKAHGFPMTIGTHADLEKFINGDWRLGWSLSRLMMMIACLYEQPWNFVQELGASKEHFTPDLMIKIAVRLMVRVFDEQKANNHPIGDVTALNYAFSRA